MGERERSREEKERGERGGRSEKNERRGEDNVLEGEREGGS